MNVITVTNVALKRMKEMVQRAGPTATGIRFGIKAGGCSGFEYVLKPIAFADERHDDWATFIEGLKITIDSRSIPRVVGTTIDWNLMGFVFHNPKAGTTCGCGSSFNLDP